MAMYLSRSIRPNKYPKIKFKIGSKARLSPSLSFLLLRGKFKRRNAATQGADSFPCPDIINYYSKKKQYTDAHFSIK